MHFMYRMNMSKISLRQHKLISVYQLNLIQLRVWCCCEQQWLMLGFYNENIFNWLLDCLSHQNTATAIIVYILSVTVLTGRCV